MADSDAGDVDPAPDPEPDDLEPEEFDPNSLGPEAPGVPDLAERASEADPETARLFWFLVFVFDVALLATSVGVMFVFFQSNWRLGGQLFLGGSILFVYGYYRYRKFRDE